VGNLDAFVFLFTVVFFHIAVQNIVTSIFINQAMRLSSDLESAMWEKRESEKFHEEELLNILSTLDVDEDGLIGEEELYKVIEDKDIKDRLELLGISIKDLDVVLRMLRKTQSPTDEEARDRFSPSSFMCACLRMKGLASAFDVAELRLISKVLLRHHQHHQQDFSEQAKSLKQMHDDWKCMITTVEDLRRDLGVAIAERDVHVDSSVEDDIMAERTKIKAL